MYSSDPRPDAGSLMQFESRRAVPQPSQPHNPNPQPGHFNNSKTRRPRSEKPLQISGSRTFLSFSCFSMANQEAVSRSAVLLLRLKALALQKRPLFVLFALVRRTAAILVPEPLGLICNRPVARPLISLPRDQETTGSGDENEPPPSWMWQCYAQ